MKLGELINILNEETKKCTRCGKKISANSPEVNCKKCINTKFNYKAKLYSLGLEKSDFSEFTDFVGNTIGDPEEYYDGLYYDDDKKVKRDIKRFYKQK